MQYLYLGVLKRVFGVRYAVYVLVSAVNRSRINAQPLCVPRYLRNKFKRFLCHQNHWPETLKRNFLYFSFFQKVEHCMLQTSWQTKCQVHEGIGSQSLVICAGKYSGGESGQRVYRVLLKLLGVAMYPDSGVYTLYSCPICTWVVVRTVLW